jgi:hypothetical protein
MKRTLKLTSPAMYGSDVQYAQRLLRDGDGSEQVFHTKWYGGKIDGIWGQQSGDAAKACKWTLGYVEEKCDPTFGTDLEKLLLGHTVQSDEQQERADQRAGSITIGARAVDWLKPYLGMGEDPPGSNQNEFVSWYGQGPEPWCGVTVTRALVGVGSVQWHRGGFSDYVPDIVRAAQSGEHGLMVVAFDHIQKGDIVCFDWNYGSDPSGFDHVGFVRKKTGGRTFDTREGNTSDQLLDRSRSLDQATCFFCRPTG